MVFLVDGGLILPQTLVVSHLEVCRQHLLIVWGGNQVGVLLLNPTLGGVYRAALVDLLGVLSNTVVFQIGSIADSTQGSRIYFVHH